MTESEFYNEEKKLLVDKEKDLLMINLLTIYDNLKDKESVDQFLLDSKKGRTSLCRRNRRIKKQMHYLV